MDLDDRGHRPLDADAVAAHDRPDRLAVRAGHRDPDGVAELVAELEDVSDLDTPLRLQRVTADGARLARGDLAQVGPRADGDVPLDVDAAQVGVVGVGAGEHAPPAAQRLVGDAPGDRRHADRAEAAGQRAERGADLLGLGRADRDGAGGVDELLLVQRVVAAQQDQGERAVQEVHQGLDLARRRGLVPGGEILDGAHARGGERFGGGKQGTSVRRNHRSGTSRDVAFSMLAA